nr:trypsin-like peptidase domain-containing protein [Paludisphaera mucosa]
MARGLPASPVPLAVAAPATPPIVEPRANPIVATPDATGPQAARLDLVKRIKDATVYLKVGGGPGSGTGSGFVIRVEGNVVYVATNHHVVQPPTEGNAPPAIASSMSWPPVLAVFRSGDPNRRESVHTAQVVAFDREDNRDLAVLKVVGVSEPPAPIDLSVAAEAVETTPLGIYGFPFGNLNQVIDRNNQGNPSVTVSRGAVSRLQFDEAGRLALVQIDGSIDPGNSGGPVVDDKGRLVGLAVSKIAFSNIGFAVPAKELERMLEGRVGRVRVNREPPSGGEAVLKVQADLIDPLDKVRSIEVLYVPTALPATPGVDGWGELAGAQRTPLARLGGAAEGTIRLAVPEARTVTLQACVRNASGRTTYEKPFPFVVPDGPNPPALAGDPGAARPVARPTNPIFGTLIDPSKVCKLERKDDVVTLQIPAGVHLLGPDFAPRSAPMALAEVEGDFDLRVAVVGMLLPGVEPAKFKGRLLPNTYQGAGLVLFEDRNNYVRIERAAATERGRPTVSNEVVIEIRDNGKVLGPYSDAIPDSPMILRLLRVGGGVRCMFGPNGQFWLSSRQLAVRFPEKVRVGLIASNASKEPLIGRFKNFTLDQGADVKPDN